MVSAGFFPGTLMRTEVLDACFCFAICSVYVCMRCAVKDVDEGTKGVRIRLR